jgi:hypothetical protein
MGMLNMIELGNTAGVASAEPVIGKIYSRASGATTAAHSVVDAYNDRAAAVIQNPFRSQLTQFVTDQRQDSKQIFGEMQKGLNSSKFSLARLQEEFIEALRAQANVEPTRAVRLL